jgi:GT2 family glycosyltransferase
LTETKLTILVPTHDRPKRLRSCLEGIARLDYDHDLFEVVVVDDGSAASLETVVADFRNRLAIRLLVQTRRGPGAARNLGSQAGRGRFLAFIDDDCVPEPKWLSALSRELEKRPDRLLGGTVINALPQNVYSTATQLIAQYVTDYYGKHAGNEPFFTTNNLAVSAERFRELGGFNTSIASFTAEDKEFCDRWRSRGYEMAMVPDAIVYHAHDLSVRRFLVQHHNYGRGILAFRLIRMRRGGSRLLPEPLRFYRGLLMAPLRLLPDSRAWVLLPLVFVSQLVTFMGALRTALSEMWKRFRTARSG